MARHRKPRTRKYRLLGYLVGPLLMAALTACGFAGPDAPPEAAAWTAPSSVPVALPSPSSPPPSIVPAAPSSTRPTPPTTSTAARTTPSTTKAAPKTVPSKKPAVAPAAKPKPAAKPSTSGCDWRTEFARNAASMPGKWNAVAMTETGSSAETQVSTGEVWVRTDVACVYLHDLMLHESMHVRQGRIYGTAAAASRALGAYGGIEVNADCAARAAGARNGSGYTDGPCAGKYAEAGRATLAGRSV